MAQKNVGKLAKRYATSLLRAVVKKEGQEGKPTPAQKIAEALNSFLDTWESQKEFSLAMQNPMFSQADRLKALNKLTALQQLPEIAIKFIEVCFSRNRISTLAEIIKAYSQAADEAAGIVSIEITTAINIAAQEASSVEQMLQQKISGKPKFIWKIDPNILGGMIIRFQDKVIDGSLSGKMKQIEQRLENVIL